MGVSRIESIQFSSGNEQWHFSKEELDTAELHEFEPIVPIDNQISSFYAKLYMTLHVAVINENDEKIGVVSLSGDKLKEFADRCAEEGIHPMAAIFKLNR